MEEIKNEIQNIKRGRPKILIEIDKKEYQKNYNKNYYQNNKDKHQGRLVCEICKYSCSKSNYSRHARVCKEKLLFYKNLNL